MNTPTEDARWTDARIREAFIYDGGESEYHDPINGAQEQRRMAGAIFDRWLAEHDAEVLRQASHNEPEEWEYAVRDQKWGDVYGLGFDLETLAPHALRNADGLVRRRPAGPWLPVPEEVRDER